MSEKAPEQTTIQREALFPLANARHKNTHLHKAASGKVDSTDEEKKQSQRVCVCVSVCLGGKKM